MEVFPQESLASLPFAPEPISQWTYENDLMEFITSIMPYSDQFFDKRQKEYRIVASEFSANALKAVPSIAAQKMAEPIPDFHNDESFGLAAKYAIAWSIVTQALLEESEFFSISHTLEADTEIECCIMLASKLYYKQALQSLRNFLENVVLQLHFCDNADQYVKWKADNYRVPPLRGRKGVLADLVARALLVEDLAGIASDLYGELNASIHGAETHLVHSGTYTGRYAGHIFTSARFRDWCHHFSRCVDLAIRVQHKTISLWSDKRQRLGLICSICHSPDLEVIEPEFEDYSITTLQCRQCGDTENYRTDWLSSQGYV